MKHTLGPWVYFYKHKYDEHHVAVPALGRSFKLALFDNGCQSENAEADARLISAAPELLEALESALDALENEGVTFWSDTQDKARAAIAKAIGEANEKVEVPTP